MMRAKADPKATTNLIYGLACLLLAGSAFAGVTMPKPDAKAQRRADDERRKQESILAKSKSAALVAKATVESRTLTGEDAAITGRILSVTTTLARKRGVSFIRLQPQRTVLGGVLEQLPYLLVVEGPFPAVAALERDLEVPANRLAVNAIQIASSDTESDKVSASIGIVAHRVPADVETKEKTNGKSR